MGWHDQEVFDVFFYVLLRLCRGFDGSKLDVLTCFFSVVYSQKTKQA